MHSAQEVLRYVEDEVAMAATGSHDFPQGMIAIGDDGCGDCFLLSVRDDGFGSIHYFAHEEANVDEGIDGIFPLAADFPAWKSTLQKAPERIPKHPVSEGPKPSPSMPQDKPDKTWWRFW